MTVHLEQRIALPRRPQEPRRVPVASVQGALALDLGLLAPPPAEDPDEVRRPGLPGALPTPDPGEVERLSHAFARALVEVLGGERGPSQLLRWSTPQVYEQLQRRATLLSRTTPSDRRRRGVRAQVRSVRHSQPHLDAVELSIHVRRGQRSQAVAARLDRRAARRRGELRVAWVCTALELG